MLINFKDDDFIDKIKKEEVSVIQFSASWCAPCKVLKPIMEKLSDEFREKTRLVTNISIGISNPNNQIQNIVRR